MNDRSVHAIAAELRGFLGFVARRTFEDRCQETAAGLTWVTLFALVPLLTVFYTILSLFPAFHALGGRVEDLVFRHFVPTTGFEIQKYFDTFTEQARELTFAGTLLLFVSAWLMLRSIEHSFNRIWRVRESRRGIVRFVLYWAVLSLGPLLACAALLVSTYVYSLAVLDELPDLPIMRGALLGLMPALLSFGMFTLLFAAVPNCRVRLRDAAIGGLVAALIFEASKALFGWLVARTSYTLVYGAFTALPLFLLWVNLSWLLLLAGAELVYALENYRSHHERQLPEVLAVLAVLERLHRAHSAGAVLVEKDLLARRTLLGRYSLEPESWERIRQRLLDAKLLRPTREGEFVLGTDTGHITLFTLYRLFGDPEEDLTRIAQEPAPPWFHAATGRILRAERCLHETLDPSLREIFDTRDTRESGNATALA